MKQRDWVSGLLLGIGLTFAFLGQFYFAAYRQKFAWDGVLFWGIAIYSFGLLLWRMKRQERGESVRRPPTWTAVGGARVLAAIGGVWLVLLAGWMARQFERVDFRGPFWMWLVGVGWFLVAFVPSSWVSWIKEWRPRPVVRPQAKRRSPQAGWLRSRPTAAAAVTRRKVAGLAVLLLVALAARTVDLEHIPANLGGDEGTQGVAALELLGPPLGNPFSTGWFSVPTMSFLAYGISMRVFGVSIAGLRVLSALVGTITVLTTFLLARELWGRRVAWLTAVAFACAHYHVHFSRLGSNQIADGLFVTLSLWLLVRALRSRRAIYFALAGAVIGLGWYSYFGARLVGVIAVCYLAWRTMVEHRFLHRYGRLLVILLGAALVVVAPLLLHYADHPHELVSRVRQVSIFSSGWLEREQEITGRSAASLLFQQFWKSISAFNYTLDSAFWYRPSIPTLDFVSGVLFVLGLLWTMAHCRWPNNGLLLTWFWLALGLGWVITENPPSSQRMAVLSPALALLVGLGLNWLIELCRRVLDDCCGRRSLGGVTEGDADRRFWDQVAGALLFVVVVLNLRYYFLVYTPTRVYGNPTTEVGTELGRYLAQQEDDYVVYFYGPPFIYWRFGTLAFMARGVEGMDVPPSGAGGLPAPDLSQGIRFVFLPERLGELDAVRERYPGGEETSVYSTADGRPLYVLYEVEE